MAIGCAATAFVLSAKPGSLGAGGNSGDAGSGLWAHWPDVPGLTPAPEVDEAALGAVDPRLLYGAVLARQMVRPVTDLTVGRWVTPEEYEANFPANTTISHVGIDWRSNAFVDEQFAVTKQDTVDAAAGAIRCLGTDRRAVYHEGSSAGWSIVETRKAGRCGDRMKPDAVMANLHNSDGIAPAGFTPAEADAFLTYLDRVPGLVDVAAPTAVRGTDGKQYIQLDVTLIPQELGDGGATVSGFFEAAFRQTGRDPVASLYATGLQPVQGRRIRYFIDPQNLLPAYSVMQETHPAPERSTRSAGPVLPDSYTVFRYSWPMELDMSAATAEGPPKLAYQPWPFEKVRFSG